MSEYTGDVSVGGAPDTRTLPDLQIAKLAVGEMNNNAYLLTCSRTGDALLVDAANEAGRLMEMVGSTPLTTVVTTHQHGDHWQALAEMIAQTGARTVAHPLDAGPLPVTVDDAVEGGDTVAVGEVSLEVIHLRGHTPGSIALLHRSADGSTHLFTGDSLFPGGPGKTWSPEDFTSLVDDLESRIFGVLPDDTWVYPGHGADTTLGAERPSVPEWRARGW